MKSVSCIEVERNLWRYIDRELSASDLAEISSHLKLCESCRGLYYERSRDARQYRLAFPETPFGEAFVAKLTKRMKAEGLLTAPMTPKQVAAAVSPNQRRGTHGTSNQPLDQVRGAGSRKDFGLARFLHQRRFRRAAAIAAMLLLIPLVVITGLFFGESSARSLGSFQVVKGAVFVGEKPSSSGEFFPGSAFKVREGGSLEIQLKTPAGGSAAELTLIGPAIFSLDPDASRHKFKASLDQGALHASVEKRPYGDLFVINTPLASAVVVGTRFELEASGAQSRLTVSEGKVRYRAQAALPSQAPVVVTPEMGPYVVREGSMEPELDQISKPSALKASSHSTAVTPHSTEKPAMEADQFEGSPEDTLDAPAESGAGSREGNELESPSENVPENLDNPVEK